MDQYISNAKENVLLLYTCDGVHIFIDLFNMEMNQFVEKLFSGNLFFEFF
jgi:hypothetical protein